MRHPIIFLIVGLGLGLGLGCTNKKDVERAKRSLYDTDFAVVYSAVLDATRESYPNLDDNPGAGAIKTSWHQVQYSNNQDDMSQTRSLSPGAGGMNSPAAAQAGMPTRLAYKRYFIRFDVTVTGGRPWRVKIVGHASEWEPGAALPVELHGPARPHWLDGRTDALTLAIYKRVKSYAVPMKDEVDPVRPEDAIPKTDPKGFANVPPEAAKRLAELKDSLIRRNYPTLRGQLFDDVAWSLGGAPGADMAMATWQADPETLDAMVRSITGGCVGAGKRVTCGEPSPGTWQLIVEQRGDAWKVASFVRTE
ncbi:MAG: hypothetical protein H6Q90_1018 [Deltaproteobacteria bacterium]|nr:hypothetical protein [Deltaproteobacteria bacterium]